MPNLGKYIVIEGADGTGKTTQADLVQEYLESLDIEVLHVKEPGGTPIAEAIRQVILDATLDRLPRTNMLLFTANRYELWHSTIKPALERGAWVICTRNYWSSIAYQGYGEGLNIEDIKSITRAIMEDAYLTPDIGILLSQVNHGTRKQRISKRPQAKKPDTFETRDGGFQSRVEEGYTNIATEFQIKTIDATRSPEDIQSDIRKIIDQSLNR